MQCCYPTGIDGDRQLVIYISLSLSFSLSLYIYISDATVLQRYASIILIGCYVKLDTYLKDVIWLNALFLTKLY